MERPVLHNYFRSSASWRVRIALAHKEIDYEYKGVHLVKGEQKSDGYTELNGMQQVPTLQIDGITLTQSLAMIEYLEETRPDKPLLPRNFKLRAQARRIFEVCNSGIQPIQNLSVLGHVAKLTEDDSVKAKWAHFYIDKGFQALEAILQETAGTYAVGDEVTIADTAIVPQVYNAIRFKVDMTKFPIITRVDENCKKLPQFIQADFANQPDCPEDLK